MMSLIKHQLSKRIIQQDKESEYINRSILSSNLFMCNQILIQFKILIRKFLQLCIMFQYNSHKKEDINQKDILIFK
ncbi:unnamed protein product [Paramecium sonneborni]|uniref:Uncharacterized protein n=1 Tax=Paramecium sonneborni TaxID=65129 RepID=A0A8S1KTK2_9CILI|nr:unnamed protein product [Paramecium sonneborni]